MDWIGAPLQSNPVTPLRTLLSKSPRQKEALIQACELPPNERDYNNRSSTDGVLGFLIFSLLGYIGLTMHGDSSLDLGHLFDQGPYYDVLCMQRDQWPSHDCARS